MNERRVCTSRRRVGWMLTLVVLQFALWPLWAVWNVTQAQDRFAGAATSMVYLPIVFNAPPPPPSPTVVVSLSADNSMDNTTGDSWFDVWINVNNTGQVVANNVQVTVSYNPGLSKLTDWPSNTVSLGKGTVTVQFPGPLVPGTSSGAYLTFQPSSSVGDNVVITYRGSYKVNNGNSVATNATRVQVDGDAVTPSGPFSCATSDSYPPLGVQPASGRGPVGTSFVFGAFDSVCGYTFAPEETVSFWANLPDGTTQPIGQVVADEDGDVQQTFDSSGYAVGCYSMVASNQDQSNQLVGPFILDSTSGPAFCANQTNAQTDRVAPLDRAFATDSIQQSTALGGVRGRVVNAQGAAVSDVLVAVRDVATGTFLASALTDEQGQYVIPSGLAIGNYEVLFSASRSLNQSSAAYADTTLTTTINEPNVTTLDASLVPGGAIQGQVIAADRTGGVEGVTVRVYGAAGARHIATTTTDANGHYMTPVLPDGSYLVRFTPSTSRLASSRAYVGTDVTAVTVNAPEQTTGINAVLSRCATCGEITGVARAQDTGAGLAGVAVAIRNLDTGRLAAQVQTDATGTFYAVLRSGTYHASYFADYAPSAVTRRYREPAMSAPISVNAPNITTVDDAIFFAGGQVQGRVTAPDGIALKGVAVIVKDAAGKIFTTAITGADGSYTTPGLANGTYQLVFRPAVGAKNLPYSNASRTVTITAPDISKIDIVLPPLS